MKPSALILRVGVCTFFSLFPLTEVENKIYSIRMLYPLQKPSPLELVKVEIPKINFQNPIQLAKIQEKFKEMDPSFIFTQSPFYSHCLIFDPDGLVRRARLKTKKSPSLIWPTYLNLERYPKDFEKISGPHLIHFLPQKMTFLHCTSSLTNENHHESTCPSLRGKKVFLTQKEDSEETYQTPVGELSFSEIMANHIHALTQKKTIQILHPLSTFFLNSGMILLGTFTILTYPVLTSALVITGVGIFFVVIFSQILFEFFNLYIPTANMILCLFTTYLIFTGYQLALQENRQWRSLKQAQYLQELDQMKTNFLSLVSHDLKTPLAKIQAIIERLRRELSLPLEKRSDWKDLFKSIENSNQEMKHFIESVLKLSKIESQKMILNKKSNDINSIIRQAVKRLNPMAHQKNLTFSESFETLFSIECDEDLMRQVITNLIDNAIKYSPIGSKIILRSFEEGEFVRVEVEDFGPGIPKEHLPLMRLS